MTYKPFKPKRLTKPTWSQQQNNRNSNRMTEQIPVQQQTGGAMAQMSAFHQQPQQPQQGSHLPVQRKNYGYRGNRQPTPVGNPMPRNNVRQPQPPAPQQQPNGQVDPYFTYHQPKSHQPYTTPTSARPFAYGPPVWGPEGMRTGSPTTTGDILKDLGYVFFEGCIIGGMSEALHWFRYRRFGYDWVK
tara:strand:- start:2537 stop:3097 length:561 start_codon:yes stop_codon:yes gene_type:complete